MSKKTFKHIALIGRPGKNISNTIASVTTYLATLNVSVIIEENTAAMLESHAFPVFSETKIPADVELMIVIGGDGSLLNAAHCALPAGLPVLGINRGRLGFLTDINPRELSAIGDVISGHYKIEERFLLTAKTNNNTLGIALNDVVLLPGETHLIEFEIFINQQFVCVLRADGIIIATPTGSTAYALSGGGPILSPQLNAIALVPMFPHTLSSRPIVVNGDASIELVISKHSEASAFVSCDGQQRIAIQPGERVHISKNSQKLQLLHPDNYDYFATLREKLGWQSHIKSPE